MDIKVLENIMQEYGLVIRAIPNKIKRIYDSYHIKDFPDGKLEYVEKFGREMCVVMESPNHAGKFVIDCAPHTYTDVKFTKIAAESPCDTKYFVFNETIIRSSQ